MGFEIDNPNIARERYIKSKQTQLTEIVDVTFTKVEESIKKMEPVEGLTKRLNDYLSHNLRKNKSGIKTNGESVSEEDWKRNDTFKFLGSNDIYLNQPLAETHYDVQDSVGTLNLDKERVETEYARIKKALENNEQWISPLVSNLNQCPLLVAASSLVIFTKSELCEGEMTIDQIAQRVFNVEIIEKEGSVDHIKISIQLDYDFYPNNNSMEHQKHDQLKGRQIVCKLQFAIKWDTDNDKPYIDDAKREIILKKTSEI